MSAKGMLLPVVLAAVVVLAGGAIPSSAARAPTSSLGPSLAAAPPLGPEVRISTPSSPFDPDRDWPAIAYNYQHHEYLVLWFNRWPGNLDIYAQRVSDSGQLVGPWFAVSYGTGNRFNPSVAYNATDDEYLVIWSLEVATDVYEVWGRRIAWNGADMGLPKYAEFKIFSWPNRSFVVPRVAWNSYRNDYLVVWSAYDTTTAPFPFADVAGIRVLWDGSMPDPHFIISTVGEPHEVDIVYNVALDGYMVVWVRGGGVSNDDIYGAFLDRYGAKINPPGEFAVNSYLSDQATPAVTTNEQNHYMVVWQHYYSSGGGDWDIYGELLQANGSVVDGPFVVANTFYDETWPEVAANGASQEYLIVWHGQTDSQDVVTARLRNADGILGPPADVSSLQLVYPWPVVACDIPGFLIVYKNTSGDCTDPQHIYGRKWLPEEMYVPLALRKCTQ